MTKTAQTITMTVISTIVHACGTNQPRGLQARAAVAAITASMNTADILAFTFEKAADMATDEWDAANGDMLAHEYSDLANLLNRLAAKGLQAC